MRFWLVTFCIFFSFLSVGQDVKTDTISSKKDTIAVKKKIKLPPVGIYAEGMMIYAPTPGNYDLSRQLGIGISYRNVSLGAFYSLFTGEYNSILIFPNQFDLLYTHGGGYLEYIPLDNRYLETGLRVSFSMGDMLWEYTETKEDFVRDEFQVLKPEVVVRLVPWKFVKLIGALGYNAYNNLKLPSATSEDFSGLTLALGIQIGIIE